MLKKFANEIIDEKKDEIKDEKIEKEDENIDEKEDEKIEKEDEKIEKEDEKGEDNVIKDDEYMYNTPYYIEYIPDLTNEKIKKEINFYLKRIEKAENDFKKADNNYYKKGIFNDKARLKDEEEANKIYIANYDSNTKRYINNSKLLHKTVTDTVGTTTNLISGFISKGLELTVKSLPPIITFLTSQLVLLIVSIIFIIGSFLFIMYLFGFKINILNPNTGDIKNIATNNEVAKIKPVYSKTETMYDKFINYLLSIQGIKNILAIYNQYISYISIISGDNDIMEKNSIDRKTIDSGRNDNIYNIKLSKYFKKDDNNIYSIIAPADFEIKYDDVKDFLTDFKKLPKNIQDTILKGNENIKLKWDLDNTNKLFETNCKNFINNENKSVKLYKNCSIKEKYDNKTYDKTKVQLINNYLGNFE